MVINLSNGNIGMGTKTPAERLSVNGTMRAREVEVEATNWPDYVFAKDYRFNNLKVVEEHILEKGHIPGMPSAVEASREGINLGKWMRSYCRKSKS